jgi:uncharacterized membrane protein YphA (DoxX/SURF4 family)
MQFHQMTHSFGDEGVGHLLFVHHCETFFSSVGREKEVKMSIALDIVGGFIGVAVTFSAIGKLTKRPDVTATLAKVGVTPAQMPLLAVLELLAAIGLLVGIWAKAAGSAAAAGLVLYFLGAVGAHLRAKETVKDLFPAALLAVISLGTLLLEVQR